MTPSACTIPCHDRCIRIRKETNILLRRPPAHAARTTKNPGRLHRVHELSIRRRIPRLHLPPRLFAIERGIERGLHLHYLHCRWNHLYRRHVSILRFPARRRAPVLAAQLRKYPNDWRELPVRNAAIRSSSRPERRRREVDGSTVHFLSVSQESPGPPAAPHDAPRQSSPDQCPRLTARANRYTAAPRPTEHR